MSTESLTKVLAPRKRFIVLSAVAIAVLAALLSLTQPLKYSASIRLLITQRAAFTLDPYTAIRSTELIGEHLAQLVSTSSFLDRVLEIPQYHIDKTYFNRPERVRRRLWGNTVEANQVRGTALLQISVYHPRREEALKIVAATAFLLSSQGGEYVGRDINVRLVDAPLASRYPVRPNIPLNVLAGASVGALIAGLWVWVDHRRKKHHGQLV